MRGNLFIANVNSALKKGVPVILDIQAWRDNADVDQGNWDGDWEDGHYVVALGLDSAHLYVEDPSLLGCRGIIPLNELESRWRDYEGDPPYDASKRAYVRMAIFIEGTKKSSPAMFCRVD